MIAMAMLLAAQISVTDTLWTEEAEGYSITVCYPEIALEEQMIGDRLEEYATGEIQRFKEGFAEYYDPAWDPEWYIDISFTHQPSPSGMICIAAFVWEYSGGAHGNTWTRAFNYDADAGTFLGVVELLGGEAQFEAFADEVMEQLGEMLVDEGWVEEGASADPDNYHSVLPVPDEEGGIEGYTVNFPPYQVACYATGPVEVFVPVR